MSYYTVTVNVTDKNGGYIPLTKSVVCIECGGPATAAARAIRMAAAEIRGRGGRRRIGSYSVKVIRAAAAVRLREVAT